MLAAYEAELKRKGLDATPAQREIDQFRDDNEKLHMVVDSDYLRIAQLENDKDELLAALNTLLDDAELCREPGMFPREAEERAASIVAKHGERNAPRG